MKVGDAVFLVFLISFAQVHDFGVVVEEVLEGVVLFWLPDDASLARQYEVPRSSKTENEGLRESGVADQPDKGCSVRYEHLEARFRDHKRLVAFREVRPGTDVQNSAREVEAHY